MYRATTDELFATPSTITECLASKEASTGDEDVVEEKCNDCGFAKPNDGESFDEFDLNFCRCGSPSLMCFNEISNVRRPMRRSSSAENLPLISPYKSALLAHKSMTDLIDNNNVVYN